MKHSANVMTIHTALHKPHNPGVFGALLFQAQNPFSII